MKIFAILFALLGMMTVMATATTTMSPSYSLAVDSAMQAPAESAESMPDVNVNDAASPRRCQSCWRYIDHCQKTTHKSWAECRDMKCKTAHNSCAGCQGIHCK